MGAGKTSAARTAGSLLDTAPVDADAELERELGMPITQFFERHGEPAFREREERIVGELLENADGGVIALGGGSLTSERVRAALARHRAVLLDVDADTAWQRAGGRGRPLARDRVRFEELHAERALLYEQAADVLIPAAERSAMARALPFVESLDQAPPGTRLVWATSASGDYPVYVGRGLLGSGFWPPRAERGISAGARRFCVTDENVRELHADALPEVATVIAIPPGEDRKTLETAESVLRSLAQAGMTRGDEIVALGGGVVGDLAGFCAATYQRGVPIVQVPTTLVAQVDSAYGGKTGVDIPEAKNYVGAYHQPAAVLADPALLGTLPAAELAAGYAEVVKTALIAGGRLWERVRDGATGEEDDVILSCARTKLAVVARDERDDGARQALNLGHTIGHAIEQATGYSRYRHGEAIALGLLAILRLSGQDRLRDQVCELFEARGLPVRLEAEAQRVADAVGRDKKRIGSASVPFVLVEAVGEVRTGCSVPDDEVLAAVRELAA